MAAILFPGQCSYDIIARLTSRHVIAVRIVGKDSQETEAWLSWRESGAVGEIDVRK